MCEYLIKQYICVDQLLGEKDVILKVIAYVDEGGKVFSIDYIVVINYLLEIIRLATKMWVMMDEEMLYNCTIIIISDIMM